MFVVVTRLDTVIGPFNTEVEALDYKRKSSPNASVRPLYKP